VPSVHAFAQLIAQTPEMKKAVEQAKHSIGEAEFVSIVGERGTEKKAYAGAIHGSRVINTHSYLEIEFTPSSDICFEHLEAALLFYSQATLFISGVENLNIAQQQRLLSIINHCLCKPIFALNVHPEVLFIDGVLDMELYHALIHRIVILPPLRERTQDLKQMLFIYLGILNEKYGKQMVGIKPSVLKALLDYPWLGNVEELELTLDLYFQQCDEGHYMDENVLIHLSDQSHTPEHMAIHINQSLVHMEKEIIRRVMQAEHMNQSRAAKRLGISRSTLWRKLNAGHLNTKEDENEKFEQ